MLEAVTEKVAVEFKLFVRFNGCAVMTGVTATVNTALELVTLPEPLTTCTV